MSKNKAIGVAAFSIGMIVALPPLFDAAMSNNVSGDFTLMVIPGVPDAPLPAFTMSFSDVDKNCSGVRLPRDRVCRGEVLANLSGFAKELGMLKEKKMVLEAGYGKKGGTVFKANGPGGGITVATETKDAGASFVLLPGPR